MEYSDLKSYMMSLDELDLNYINRNNLEPDYEHLYKPLWRASKKPQEFYKLEIFSDYEVFTPKYKCHVCDIQVPVMYSDDHDLSERHRICLEIMDIALERTRAYVKHKTDTTHISPKSHTYFCNVCNKAVSLDRMSKHTSSKQHLKSMKQEQFLSKLLSSYNNEEIDDFNLMGAKDEKKEPVENDFFTVINKIAEPQLKLDEKPIKYDKEVMVQINDFMDEKIIEREVPKNNGNDNENHDNKSNILGQEKVHHYKGVNHMILIKSKDGCKIKVPFENYNGIITKDYNKYCLLCSECVADVEYHVSLAKHRHIISTTVKNVHCLRQINDFLKHCIICNDLALHSETHKNSVEHLDIMSKLLSDLDNMFDDDDDETSDTNEQSNDHDKVGNYHDVVSENQNVTDKSESVTFDDKKNSDCETATQPKVVDKTFCEVCNAHVPVDMKGHERGMKHRMKLKQAAELENNALNYQIQKIDTDDLVCRVCNEVVIDIDAHLSSAEHSRKYKDLLDENKLKLLPGDRFLCAMCNCYILKSYELYHVTGKRHWRFLKKERRAAKRSGSVNSESGSINNVSEYEFLSTSALNSMNHVTRSINSAFGSMNSVTGSMNYELGPVINVPESAVVSTSGLKSINHVAGSINSAFGSMNSVTGSMNYELGSVINVPESAVVSTSALKSINPGAGSINSAFGSMNSVTGSVNSVISDNICPPYFCEICQVQVPNRIANIEEHKNGVSHKKKLLAAKNTVSNVAGNAENVIKKDQFCRLCNIMLSSKIAMGTHIKSDSHMQLHALVLKTNRIWKRTDTTYFCDYCKVEISAFNETDHVNGAKHLKNRKNPTNLGLELFKPC